MVGREISWPASSGGGAPHGPASVAGGWTELPPSVQSSTARRWLNGLTWFPVWRAFFLGFLELKNCLGGEGFIWNHKLCLYRV